MNYQEKIQSSIDKLKTFVSKHNNELLLLENEATNLTPIQIVSKIYKEKYTIESTVMAFSNPTYNISNFGRWNSGAIKNISEEQLKIYSEEYAYFLTKYSTLTWLVTNDGVEDVESYLIDNTTGSAQFLIALPLVMDSELVVVHFPEAIGEDEDGYPDYENFNEEILWQGKMTFSEWLEKAIDKNIHELTIEFEEQ